MLHVSRFTPSPISEFSRRLFIAASAFSVLFGGLAWGQNETEDVFKPGPNLFLKSLEMLLWLSVVVALIFVTVWLLKKVTNQGRDSSHQKPIRLMFQETISHGKSVCLMRVLDQIHVIGVTNSQISYLSTLEDEEVNRLNQWLESEPSLEPRLKGGFQTVFQRLGRKTGR